MRKTDLIFDILLSISAISEILLIILYCNSRSYNTKYSIIELLECKIFDAQSTLLKILLIFARSVYFVNNLEECLALLCATCICHHTDMHALNGSLPHYENIQQSYKTAY